MPDHPSTKADRSPEWCRGFLYLPLSPSTRFANLLKIIASPDVCARVLLLLDLYVRMQCEDIYICVTSSKHRVAPEGKYIAVIATRVETDESGALAEIEPALSLLGSVDDMSVFSHCGLFFFLRRVTSPLFGT